MKAILLILAAATLNASAGVVKELVKDVKFQPNDESALEEFRIQVTKYTVTIGGVKSYGHKMIASYKTKEVADLQDYAVVQYIKGCKYEHVSRNGEVEVVRSIAREFFDDIITFTHKNWVIDSVDADPVYNSATAGRHDYYRWNTIMDSDNKPTERFFVEEAPTNNRLYVRDMPGTSSLRNFPQYNSYMATTTSLKFKTCIFKTEDVPLTVDSPETNLMDKALKCFDWNSSFVFNPETKSFDSPEDIAPLCL